MPGFFLESIMYYLAKIAIAAVVLVTIAHLDFGISPSFIYFVFLVTVAIVSINSFYKWIIEKIKKVKNGMIKMRKILAVF